MGVYTWIRENVKQAVLLGFNDAIETIGPPEPETKFNENLAAVFQQPAGAVSGSAPRKVGGPKRKRLGRSLNQIQDAA